MKSLLGIGVRFLFFSLFISGIIGAFCWPYVINTWLVYAGKTACIVWWHGFLLGYVPGLGQLSIGAAALTWLIMLFL